MQLIHGGEFWVGADPSEYYSDDESPRFRTRVADFCLDATEVTVEHYAACVERGACEPAASKRLLCNAGHAERSQHPINCVDFYQAATYCQTQSARLPSEVEWEYAAREGEHQLRYPWGNDSPDGHACWKEPTTCPVKSYPADPLGLFDLSGNVWEWTDSWYGPYPFPPVSGFAKVYRGGSFSRRFEKWMHTRLRNRAAPESWGAHLGFRCAATPPGVSCPFGAAEDGTCLAGVLGRDCPRGKKWNGVRCAELDAPRCQPGRVEKPGFGCVAELPLILGRPDREREALAVRRRRASEFDSDCGANQRDRPHAFRYLGGTHEARTLVAQRDGCKNRDVGVGWNSACCP